MNRLRVVGFVVHPQLMVDDGDNLTVLDVEPVTVPGRDWADAVEQVNAALERLRAQVEVETPEPDA